MNSLLCLKFAVSVEKLQLPVLLTILTHDAADCGCCCWRVGRRVAT